MCDYSPFVAEDQELSKMHLCDPDFACPACGASEALQTVFSHSYDESGEPTRVWMKCFVCELKWGKKVE